MTLMNAEENKENFIFKILQVLSAFICVICG